MSAGLPEIPRVRITRMGGRKLRCTVGKHVIFTDRKAEDGGSEAGCTSGEVLLVAIGSCATGSARRYLDDNGLPSEHLAVNVGYEQAEPTGAHDLIIVDILVPAGLEDHHTRIPTEALTGGVVSRFAPGSQIRIQCRQAGPGENTETAANGA